MSKIGGLAASTLPIMRVATPWLSLVFLLQLSNIIRERSKINFRNEQIKYLDKTLYMLIGMNECIDDIKLSIDLKHEIMQLKTDVQKVINDLK